MQTVCETGPYLREATACGLGQDELSRIVEMLANDPASGAEIVGSGGFRKFRIAGRGKGKSGGYRVISFYSGELLPVFLITIFSKGEKSNLSDAEVRDLRRQGKEIVAAYKRRVAPWRSRR